MSSPSPIAAELARSFVKAKRDKNEVSEKEAVKVSGAVSSVAFFYEKIRNVIDYKEDHLFRQGAIERNLQRLGFPKREKANLAESLVKDLIRSRYLNKDSVSQRMVKEVADILKKYLQIEKYLQNTDPDNAAIQSWLLNVASAEIENSLSPDPENEAVVSVFYQLLLPNIKESATGPHNRNILTYLAARRTLLRSSRATLRFSLLLGFHPEWVQATADLTDLAQKLPQTISEIESYLHLPNLDRLQLYLRRFTAPFLILKDVLSDSSDKADELIRDRELFEKNIRETCQNRYRHIRSRLTRAATRSIVYIFLTKMVLALFLELPYDLLVAGEINTLPLIVNTVFPPFLMFALVLSIPKPGEKNTRRIISDIDEIVYKGTFKTPEYSLDREKVRSRSLRGKVFRFTYLLTFMLTFGLIIWGLTLLNFNIFSIIIFLFFITVVSFFAYRISQSAREIVVEEKETTLSAVVDFFMIPILRTGRNLSLQLSKINVFNFILDFVIEAPLKNILEIVEDWLNFVKEKKDEVI